MSFDKLKTIILSEAKAEADQRKATLDERRKTLQDSISHKASETEETIIRDAEKIAEREERRVYQQAKLSGKTSILKAKEEELLKTAKDFKEQVLSWDKEKTQSLLNALLDQVPSSKKGSLVAGKAHAEILQSLAKKDDLKVEKETLPNEGGFRYHSPDMEIDFTISNLIDRLFKKYRADIAKALFV